MLSPSGDLPEVLPDLVFGGGDELTVRAYVELIRKAKTDSRIAGILLRPGGINSPFWAKLQELREAIDDFKTSGKYVHAWLEYGGDREYFLASVADKVYLLPSASLDLTGVASYEVFLRGTFDWIGTYPDFLHVGDYKTAVNTYLEKTFTPAHKEMSESLNRSQYDQLVDTIADGARQERGGSARADRSGPVPAGRGAARRADRRSRVRRRARRSRAAAERRRLHRRRGLRGGVVGTRPACARRSKIAVINAVRRDQFRQQRLRSGQRRGRRIGFAGRIHPRGARRPLDQGDRAARRQPGRIVDGVRRDLARAVDLAGEPSAGDRVDVGPGRVGRLLHRARRRRDRRAAGHADRIDRRLHRQVRDQRLARQARREHRSDEPRQARARSIRPIAGSRRKSAPRSKSRCRSSTTSSSSGPPRRGT